MVRWKKSCILGMCQNSVLAPYCMDWEPKHPPMTSQCLRFSWIPLIYLQTPPTHPPDTPKVSPGNNTCQQTSTDTARHPKTLTGAAWVCLAVSFGICCGLLACRVPWRCMGGVCGMSVGCLWDIWGCLGVSEWFSWKAEALGCVRGVSSLQYRAKTLFWHSPERHDLFSPDYTKTSKYQNVHI